MSFTSVGRLTPRKSAASCVVRSRPWGAMSVALLAHDLDHLSEQAVYLRRQRNLFAVRAQQEPGLGVVLDEAREVRRRGWSRSSGGKTRSASRRDPPLPGPVATASLMASTVPQIERNESTFWADVYRNVYRTGRNPVAARSTVQHADQQMGCSEASQHRRENRSERPESEFKSPLAHFFDKRCALLKPGGAPAGACAHAGPVCDPNTHL